ncbi:SurA domain-containing protein [Hyphomicrobium denitrificans 1NES1]|uniref:SurA domain-containing protein n=1 Tax=Hyphomicrobium denitrificans 1NES1 TaxID=670307 RepID=N0B2K7_9HYPH|nr:SurA domain-containing protein [Hyphomicrobium denitrificans 1NES1]
MPFSQDSSLSLIFRLVRVFVAAGLLAVLWTLPVLAQGGTVAVTGDGTGGLFGAPAVGNSDKTGDKAADKKGHKKSAPAAKNKDTETASRNPISSDPIGGENVIEVLVNDEPITGFEVDRRATLLSGASVQSQAKANFEAIVKNPKTTERLKAILNQVVQANQGKPRDVIIDIFEKKKKEFGMTLQREAFESARKAALPAVKKQAIEELIDERLKLQEAKKQSVTIEDAEVNRVLTGIAERNKMTLDQFTKQIGGSIDPMKNRIRAALSWNEVVRRRFGPLISVNTKDVDKLVAAATDTPQDDVELQIQRVRIMLPKKMEEHGIALRIEEAEKVRSRFTDCKSTAAAATGIPGAKFEAIGKRKSSTLPEPTRTLLLNASDGEMLPPTVGDGAVELYVVCGRDSVKTVEDKRTQAEGELKQKEFEVMAKRYLKDLREDAHIEYR